MSAPLLEIQRLRKHFPVGRSLLRGPSNHVRAVDGVDLSISQGETFSIVGESGCGKTTIARLVLLLETVTDGVIRFEGKEIRYLSRQDLRTYRKCVQAVFQDPYSSLSPRMRIGDIVAEPVVVNHTCSSKEVRERVDSVLELVGLNRNIVARYPHELSGGQRQRVALARAAAVGPKLIVLDEPVSSLDVSVQAQIVNLLEDIQDEIGTAYLLISHDLAVVEHMSQHVAVMYLGKIVEIGPRRAVYDNPRHPYTQALLSAALPLHPDAPHRQLILRGEVGSPIHPPSGCRFHPRCFRPKPVCSQVEPRLTDVGDGRKVACHLD